MTRSQSAILWLIVVSVSGILVYVGLIAPGLVRANNSSSGDFIYDPPLTDQAVPTTTVANFTFDSPPLVNGDYSPVLGGVVPLLMLVSCGYLTIGRFRQTLRAAAAWAARTWSRLWSARLGLGNDEMAAADPDRPLRLAAVLATVGVVVGFEPMPSSYYMLLRFSLCLASALMFTLRLEEWQRWALIASVVLYNPLIPIRLGDKDTWIVMNIGTVVLLWTAQARPLK